MAPLFAHNKLASLGCGAMCCVVYVVLVFCVENESACGVMSGDVM